eukprot:3939898-Rhodomonas_salina.1
MHLESLQKTLAKVKRAMPLRQASSDAGSPMKRRVLSSPSFSASKRVRANAANAEEMGWVGPLGSQDVDVGRGLQGLAKNFFCSDLQAAAKELLQQV